MKDLKSIGTTLFLISLLLFAPQAVKSQDNKTVNITSSGNGATQKEATQVALRSAIEQTFGVFISSKTEIFDDQIVADEIASVANGNIQSYNVLNQSQLPDGTWSVTLNAVISISKLTSFVQSKGVSVEIKGGLFAINIKQQILNEKAEKTAIENMIVVLRDILQTAFDYKITAAEPISNNDKWNISVRVTKSANKNLSICSDILNKTLSALSLKSDEEGNYKSINKNTFIINGYHLRNESSLNALYDFKFWLPYFSSLYEIKSGEHTYGAKRVSYGSYYRFEHKNEDVYGTSNKINFDFSSTFNTNDNYTFSYTLEEIEKLTGFSVMPLGKVLEFKQGGIFVPTEKGDGFILAYTANDPESLSNNWESANSYCKDLKLSGYSDWRLPSDNELQWIFNRFGMLNIPFMFPDVNYQQYVAWSDAECGSTGAYARYLHEGSSQCIGKGSRMHVLAVRSYQKKLTNSSINKFNIESDSVKDIDGNVYKTVTIGTQTWMAENLKTTKYNDGRDIPKVSKSNNVAWSALNSGASCSYHNSELYNWYAVNTGKLAPSGWHIPTFEEWKTLALYLIANGYNHDSSTTNNLVAKSLASQTGWEYSSLTEGNIGNNKENNNKSGFSALPSGCRDFDGNFKGYGAYGYWWTATETESNFAVNASLEFQKSDLRTYPLNKLYGLSIRCVKDKK